jgi:hypothetical protein
MSLPLFDKKRMATTIMERRNRDGSKGASAEINPESPGPSGGLQDMAVDLLQAIERKSPSEIADAFESMFRHCESSVSQEDYGDDEDQE